VTTRPPEPPVEAPDAPAPDRPAPDALSRALDGVLARFAAAARRAAARAGLDRDDLEDLLQEVRIRLWRALSTAERIEGARALYVHRVVGSAAVDLVRRRRARREEALTDADDPASPARADADADRAELDAALARALDALPPSRRVAVRLHLAGYDRQEIATMLGWTEPKTRNLLYRGLADLRAQLERAGVRAGGDA
jgi:RNA polymerase sigma-70 factor (ECF subfamily)